MSDILIDNNTTTLFIGNLSIVCTESDLETIFAPYNVVKVEIKQSSGLVVCGFVTFDSEQQAESALINLNTTILFGRYLRVGWTNETKPVSGKILTADIHFTFFAKQTKLLIFELTVHELLLELGCSSVLDVEFTSYSLQSYSSKHFGSGFIRLDPTQQNVCLAKQLCTQLKELSVDGVVVFNFSQGKKLSKLFMQRPQEDLAQQYNLGESMRKDGSVHHMKVTKELSYASLDQVKRFLVGKTKVLNAQYNSSTTAESASRFTKHNTQDHPCNIVGSVPTSPPQPSAPQNKRYGPEMQHRFRILFGEGYDRSLFIDQDQQLQQQIYRLQQEQKQLIRQLQQNKQKQQSLQQQLNKRRQQQKRDKSAQRLLQPKPEDKTKLNKGEVDFGNEILEKDKIFTTTNNNISGNKNPNNNDNNTKNDVITYADGSVYSGSLSKAQINGKSSLKLIDDGFKRHGKGIMKYIAGDVYDGDWKDNMRHGNGVMKYANGDVYDGEWSDGCAHGRGVMKYVDGGIYDGEWVQEKRHGKGVMNFINGDIYNGFWLYGNMSVRGLMNYSNGDVYDGQWRHNNRHDNGVMKYGNGNVYDGDWVEGKKHGKGVLKYADGSVYDGGWKNDNIFDEWNNVLSDNLDWLLPLDTSSNVCCLVSLISSSLCDRSADMNNNTITDSDIVLQRIKQLFHNNQHSFGRHTIHNSILYNPAHNMRATIYIKFDEYAGNLLDIKTFIENIIDFNCDTVDVVLWDGAHRLSACHNPEMESLDADMLHHLDWSAVADKHCLKNYTQSIVADHGDFVMFGPTFDYATKSWSNVVSLWVLYYDAISRHFMYTPNEHRLVSHMGIRVQHFYSNFEQHRFSATDIGERGLWQQTDSHQEFYVGNAFHAAHPTIKPNYMRKATIGPRVRTFCRDLPDIIPDNWFVTAAHTFALPDKLINGDVIPPIPYNSPIYDTAYPNKNKPIGTYLGHDLSQCTAIIEITCPKLSNLMRVTQNEQLEILGPDDTSFAIDIDNINSSVWKDTIYKTGGTTATTCGMAHSYGCKLNPTKYGNGVITCPDDVLQYLLVLRFPAVQQTDNKFSERGDSGAGVYTLVPSISGVNQYSAKVFGLLEGAITTNSAPFYSAIQPIHVPSLRKLVLRIANIVEREGCSL